MSIKKNCFPYYEVKQGDTLNSISRKFGIQATKLLLDNNIAPKQIKAGIMLKIKQN